MTPNRTESAPNAIRTPLSGRSEFAIPRNTSIMPPISQKTAVMSTITLIVASGFLRMMTPRATPMMPMNTSSHLSSDDESKSPTKNLTTPVRIMKRPTMAVIVVSVALGQKMSNRPTPMDRTPSRASSHHVFFISANSSELSTTSTSSAMCNSLFRSCARY